MSNVKYGLGPLLAFILLQGVTSQGQASFINMNTTPHGSISNNQVSLVVETVNKGDEKAFNVRLEAQFPGASQSSPLIPAIGTNGVGSYAFEWKLPTDVRYRQLVIPVLTIYADANLYPFSSVSHAMVANGTPAVIGFASRVESATLATSGSLRLCLQCTDGKSHKVTLRPVFPREIRMEPTSAEVTIPATGETDYTFTVRNFSALSASTYAIWVIVAEDTSEGIVEDAVIGNVLIVTGRHLILARWRWGIASLAGVLAIMYLYQGMKPRNPS